MSLVVYLALLASVVLTLRRGPGQALLIVYLPALLMIPDAFHAITPGLPDPNFHQAAILPIVAIGFLRHRNRWRPRAMDGLMLIFAVWVAWSDYTARGYADAQNLMFTMLTSVIFPYAVARIVIPAEQLHVAVGRRYVTLIFAVALIGVFEFRFPGQGTGWVTTFRHGMARVAGPYSHAILAGIMMVSAYRLHRWLQWGGYWEPRFSLFPSLVWSKPRVISVVLFVAALMTVARGPWIGALLGGGIAAVGRSRNRKQAIRLFIGFATVGAIVGFWAMVNYLDIRPGGPMTLSQETALYRKVLFEKYAQIALDHAWFGWGLTTWPKVDGMESIDNYYLLLSLMHGIPATVMLVVLMLGSAWQCVARGLKEGHEAASPVFAFAGLFIAVFVSIGTVYLGEQVMPMLFFMMGWAQAWLQSSHPVASQPVRSSGAVPAPTPGRFRYVIQ
ncbi:MAG: O-antigen ligase domain-containing protein [Betaproteobacteria bacterium]|nr:O-antigen ligase domain-containing protein [Betaproteobacteria bacterium]